MGALRSWRAGLQTESERKQRAQGVAVGVVYNDANVHLQDACACKLYSLDEGTQRPEERCSTHASNHSP